MMCWNDRTDVYTTRNKCLTVTSFAHYANQKICIVLIIGYTMWLNHCCIFVRVKCVY